MGADTAKGAIRGGETGVLSSTLRFGGIKAALPVLSDATAATVMAGGLIDGGTALYAYAKGEISGRKLEQDYHRQLAQFMEQYQQQQRMRLSGLLDAFAHFADDDTSYERAVYAILAYADQTGMVLQHASFDEFTSAMQTDSAFVLK